MAQGSELGCVQVRLALTEAPRLEREVPGLSKQLRAAAHAARHARAHAATQNCLTRNVTQKRHAGKTTDKPNLDPAHLQLIPRLIPLFKGFESTATFAPLRSTKSSPMLPL